jgi:hypothetical protein
MAPMEMLGNDGIILRYAELDRFDLVIASRTMYSVSDWSVYLSTAPMR